MERLVHAALARLSEEELARCAFYLRSSEPARGARAELQGADGSPAQLAQRYAGRAAEVLREALRDTSEALARQETAGAAAAPAAVLRTGEQQTGNRRSDTSFKGRRTEQSDYDELDTYDMSKTRVAFMMCVTTGRHGAEKDIEVMNKWFGKYQFETPSGQCIDPNGQEILPALEEFRDQINQSEDEISCCLITLMSHGRSHGLIQGKDGDTVDLDDIFALFNNIQCPKLQEKPKIFIIQACRGGKEDHGVEEIEHESKEANCIYNLIAVRRLPTASDYYVVYSTQKGYVSLRNTEKGSRMIEAMDEVFSEQGMKWHIGDLFTKINKNLVQETFSIHGCPVKETIVVESTLTKAVYLAP
ncbi:caspase-14-like [Terrapene carolina triunguis]|uniref:caspase-14-like n=1 Tax=Terrapene triunguis TaxID=2587831 RepID=UPI000E77CB77|nr:caspase-14-like [Terrapene carolina triunguis]